MDRMMRPARLLGLVCLLPLAVTGCRTIVPTKPAANPNAPQTLGATGAPPVPKLDAGSIVKTEFRAKVTPDQEFNVHLELGKQQIRDRQFDSALAEFKKAFEASKQKSGLRNNSHRIEQQALAHRKIASALDWLGRFKESEEHYKQATKLTPNDPRVWNDFGYSYYMQSRLGDAERCLRKAEKLDPDSPLVKVNIGLTLAADGRTADALEVLSRSSGKAVGHANLGYALASQGREVEARDEYRKALELQPQLAIARQALARLDDPRARVPEGNNTQIGMAPSSRASSVPPTAIAMPTPVSTPQPSAVSDASALPPAPVNLEGPALPAATAAEIAPLPAPGTATSAVVRETDGNVRPTSVDRPLVDSPAQTKADPGLASIPIPPPIPAPIRLVPPRAEITPQPNTTTSATPRPGAFPSSAIPMPVPAPQKAKTAAGGTKATLIPMPVPIERQLAPPVSQRSLNATSVPAIDPKIRPVPSSAY